MKIAIIGAGLGGLLAGAALAPEHEVHVFERLEMYGGRFTNLPYKGFQLTTGALHMIPHGPTGPLAMLLKDVGAKVEIVRTKPDSTIMTRDNRQVPFMSVNEILPGRVRIKVPVMAIKILNAKKGTCADIVGNDPELLPIADSFCGWALSTRAMDTPAAEISEILKIVQKYGTPGIPMGGCGTVVAELVSAIESHGGRVSLNARVDAIKVDGGRVTGITVNGDFHPADAVISDIGHRLTSELYDHSGLNPGYFEVVGKTRPSAGIKISLAAEEPLIGHAGNMFTPYTQRINGANEVTHIDPSIAPEGMHLTMTHQTMRSNNVQEEIKLGLQDIKNMFPGKKYSVLLVQTYHDDWPVNRISSGFDLGNLTPVKGLYVVGDGAKGKGGIEVEGVAMGVRNMLELFEKSS